MSRRAFDAEVALDLAVNFIPPIIIAFFVVVFAVINPWGFDPLASTIQFTILVSMIVAVAIITYVGARLIETDPRTQADRGWEQPSVDDQDDPGQGHREADTDEQQQE